MPKSEAIEILKTKHQLKNNLDKVEDDLKYEAKENSGALVKKRH